MKIKIYLYSILFFCSLLLNSQNEYALIIESEDGEVLENNQVNRELYGPVKSIRNIVRSVFKNAVVAFLLFLSIASLPRLVVCFF